MIDRERTIFDVLYRKQAILDYENIGLKNSKIGIFPKGLVHRFRQKFEISSTFIFMRNRSRKSIWGRSSSKKVLV